MDLEIDSPTPLASAEFEFEDLVLGAGLATEDVCGLGVVCKAPCVVLGQDSSRLKAQCKLGGRTVSVEASSEELGQGNGKLLDVGLFHGNTRGLVGQRRGGLGLWVEDGRGRDPMEASERGRASGWWWGFFF